MVWWWRRLVVESAKLVFFSLEIVICVSAHLAIGTSLMGPTMSGTKVSLRFVTVIRNEGEV